MNVSFRRKLIYLVLIAALLYPLSQLSQPATRGTPGEPDSPGGTLARLRQENHLGQANLGEIDPGGAAIKLATLGMDGVAATVLWQKSEDYAQRKDWIGLKAVLDQIIHLQPNFVGVWQFQAHNLAFNISQEWDDLAGKYYWIIQGIKFMQQGIDYNANEPRLLSDVGYIAMEKLGQSDDKVQFRKMFREDDAFHAGQPVQERDDFLFAAEYYREAERVAEIEGAGPIPMAPVLFYSRSALARTMYCEALELDYHNALVEAAIESGRLRESREQRDERLDRIDQEWGARITAAWAQAHKLWKERLGDHEFVNQYGGRYRLNDLDTLGPRRQQTFAAFDKLAQGIGERIRRERIAKLEPDQREALETDPGMRNEKQMELAYQAEFTVTPSFLDIAEQVDAANRKQAVKLANELIDLDNRLLEVGGQRSQANYDYWVDRCAMEQTPAAREARRLQHHGHVLFRIEADLPRARETYEQTFAEWRKVFDASPQMLTDTPLLAKVGDGIAAYRDLLHQLDQPFPKEFLLADVVAAEQERVIGAPPE